MRITRPAPAARVALAPKAQGAFGAAGAIVQFNQTVRNTGEFGTDTYDLTVNSSWPTTLYHADGSTPLTDTDGDGTPDTGPVAQGGSKTIVVKTVLPGGAAGWRQQRSPGHRDLVAEPDQDENRAPPDRRARAVRADLFAIRLAQGRLLPPRPASDPPDDRPVRL